MNIHNTVNNMTEIELKKKLLQIVSKVIDTPNNKKLFLEGLAQCQNQYEFDMSVHLENSYTENVLEVNKIKSTLEKLSRISSTINNSSLQDLFRNSQTHFRTELLGTIDGDNGIQIKGRMHPSQEAIWNSCNGFFFELNNDPNKTIKLVISSLLSALDENIDFLKKNKGKKIETNKKKELALNVTYVYAMLGGRLSYSEKSILPKIITQIFHYYKLSTLRDDFDLNNGSSGSAILESLCDEEKKKLISNKDGSSLKNTDILRRLIRGKRFLGK